MSTPTFTELFPGAGGTKMDESLVPNAPAGGAAHRANVAVGFGDGALQTHVDEGGEVKASVKDTSALAELVAILAQVATLLTDAQLRAAPVSTIRKPTSAARTSVPAAAADTLLLASNASRVFAFVFNDSNSPLYVGLGAAAVTSTDFTYLVSASTLWQTPDGYTGPVRGLWNDPQGAARLTELT